MREAQYQRELIKRIKQRFPGCIVLKNDPNYIQGVPDLLILTHRRWAALEVKQSATASHRPNQDYYVELMNELAYASYISPETEEEVLDEVQRAFELRW